MSICAIDSIVKKRGFQFREQPCYRRQSKLEKTKDGQYEHCRDNCKDDEEAGIVKIHAHDMEVVGLSTTQENNNIDTNIEAETHLRK